MQIAPAFRLPPKGSADLAPAESYLHFVRTSARAVPNVMVMPGAAPLPPPPPPPSDAAAAAPSAHAVDEAWAAAVLSTFSAARAQLEAWVASGAVSAAAAGGGGGAETWCAAEDEEGAAGDADWGGDEEFEEGSEGAWEEGEEAAAAGGGGGSGAGGSEFWAASDDDGGEADEEGGGGAASGAGALPHSPPPPPAATLSTVLAMDHLAVLGALQRAVRRACAARGGAGGGPGPLLGLAEGAWLYALLCALHKPLLGTTSALLRELFLALRDSRARALAAGGADSAQLAAEAVVGVIVGRFFGARLEGEGM